MAIATLSIDLEAKLATLERDLNKASKLVEKQAKETERRYAELTENAKNIGAEIGKAFAVGAVVNFAKSTVDALDALNDVKDATGASIENISALEDVALRTGTSLETVSGVLVKFNAGLKEADGKNGVSQALKAIGLNAEELRKMDPAEALTKTAQALAGFADDGGKARVVQELFGKSVREAAPFLNDLAEMGLKNKTVTAQQAAEAEKLNKQLAALQKSFTDVARAVTSVMLPSLQRMIDDVRLGTEAYGGFWAAVKGIGLDVDPFKSINENLSVTTSALASLREESQQITKTQAQYKDIPLFSNYGVDRLKQINRQVEELTRRERYLRSKQLNEENGGRGAPSSYFPEPNKPKIPDLPDKPKAAKSVTTEAERYLETLTKQLQTTEKLTEVQKALADIERKSIDGLNVSAAGKILDVAAQIDAKKEQEAAYKDVLELMDAEAEAHKRNRDEADRYFEGSLTGAEKLRAELSRVNDLFAKGAFGDTDSPEAQAKLDKVTKSVQEKLKDIDGAGSKLATSLRDNLSDTFFDVMDGKLDNLGDRFKVLVLRMAADAAAAKLTESLFGSLPGKSGSSAADSLLSSLAGLIGGKFAGGGDPPVGKVSLVGERGPELFVPKRAGTVIPNHLLGRSSVAATPSVEIVQHISVGEGVSRSQLNAAMRASKNEAKAEIMRSMRVRGAFEQ